MARRQVACLGLVAALLALAPRPSSFFVSKENPRPAVASRSLLTGRSPPSVSFPDSLSRPTSKISLLAAATEAKAAVDIDEDNESISVEGFAAFLISVAVLPYVVYVLVFSFKILFEGASFEYGPYGLELISIAVSIGLVCWSLGSFLQRGKGLPAGPLGLLGLAEGIAYLATLFVAIDLGAIYFRGVPATPPTAKGGTTVVAVKAPAPAAPAVSVPSFKAPEFKAPDIKVPEIKAPDIKVPDFKAPDIKVPAFKAPDIKVPDIKAPDIKVPEFKAPDLKVPDIKVPEIKVPEVKAPKIEAPKKVEAPKKEEPKKEAPKKEEPKKAATVDDFSALFD